MFWQRHDPVKAAERRQRRLRKWRTLEKPRYEARGGPSTYRMLTARLRSLPHFIIIGGMRCGSTSLYQYLAQHPNVYPAIRKEVHFFDRHYVRGPNWYRAHFPCWLWFPFIRATRGASAVTGEATAYYSFHPLAAPRIAELMPQVRVIAILRNPVARAYSHYWHEVKRGREKLSFTEAIESEADRLEGEAEKLCSEPNYSSFHHAHFSYLARGRYAEQLEAWMKFFPGNQILVLQSEDFFANTAAVLDRVSTHLGLPPCTLHIMKVFNKSTYPPMEIAMSERLYEYFRPHNERLSKLVGMEFFWDSTTIPSVARES